MNTVVTCKKNTGTQLTDRTGFLKLYFKRTEKHRKAASKCKERKKKNVRL